MRQTASLRDRSTKAPGRAELREVIREVNEVSKMLKLASSVRKRAVGICSDALTMPFCQGVPRSVLATAALYVACREAKTPVTLREFANTCGSDPRQVGRCYIQILDNVHISRPGLNGKGYVYHLALKRSVSGQALSLAQNIINTTSTRGLGGRNPMTLAAAALYLACCSLGENITQAEVAEAAGVGEESVRECCKEIRTLANLPVT